MLLKLEEDEYNGIFNFKGINGVISIVRRYYNGKHLYFYYMIDSGKIHGWRTSFYIKQLYYFKGKYVGVKINH